MATERVSLDRKQERADLQADLQLTIRELKKKKAFPMRHRWMVMILGGVGCALLAGAPIARAQDAQPPRMRQAQSSPATPDFTGIWEKSRSTFPGGSDRFAPEEPPMTAWAEERYRAARQGVLHPLDQGREDVDPMLYPYCMPPGMPRIHLRGQAMEIIQAPGRVYFLFEAGPSMLRIHTDGRKHLSNPPPSFMGDTIGRWDGDTLITETVGLHDWTWLDSAGHPHSSALRVEQRIRRPNYETLEISLLFDDPKVYTRPWTAKKVYRLRPDWEVLEYLICEDTVQEKYTQEVLGGSEGP